MSEVNRSTSLFASRSASLLVSRGNQKDVKSAPSLGLASAGFPLICRKSPQRALRRKRQDEVYPHYAAVVFDEDGSCHLLSSPSLTRQKRYILADAAVRAQEVLEEIPGSHQGSISFPFDSKRRRVDLEDPDLSYEDVPTTIKPEEETSYDAREMKRSLIKKNIPYPSKLRAIRVDDTQSWRSWYFDGFTTIQQTACRTIAKEWIRAIHPKKQSTHPYNGKTPRSESISPDPERTRPPYWPPFVRHKEPDHIDKSDRTELLVYLLMRTPQVEITPEKTKSEKSFTARDLLAALQMKRDDGVLAKWRVIEELVNAREELESYEAGGIDGDAVLHVPDWGEILRAAGSRKKGNHDTQVTRPVHEEEPHTKVSEDEKMQNDPIDAGQPPLQQSFQETDYDQAQMKALPYSLPSGDDRVTSEHQISIPRQQQPMHAAFQEAAIQYTQPLNPHAIQTDGPSPMIDHHTRTGHLSSFVPPSWLPQNTIQTGGMSGVIPMAPFTYGMVDPAQFAAARPLSQMLLGHGMIGNTPYGDGDNYSFAISQPSDGGYDFNQMNQYHQLEFPPHYELGWSFGGF